MKLVKILILALGLMSLAATASFANVNFISSAGQRNLAVNAETGMTSTILLSATGPEFNPNVPINESIFLTYSVPISMLGDIVVRVKDAQSAAGDFTAYNQWVAIGTYARARVGLSSSDYYNIQIQFLEQLEFLTGESIEVGGVRVDTVPALGMAVGAIVTVDFTNAIGEAVVTNGEDLPVAILREPITISNASPPIQFLADGTPVNDVATATITELFTNAFETKSTYSEILISVTDVPAGVAFVGISGVQGAGDVSAYACATNLICITAQNESLLESIDVGLQFALVDTPNFSPSPATVQATLYPPKDLPYYPEALPLRYANRWVTGTVSFGVQGVLGGKLLSVFNAVATEDEMVMLDTGIGIMNGSAASGLPPAIGQAGTIEVYMYPMDGSGPYYFETSSTMKPGLGLDSNGRLVPKGTWAVLVSQLLPYAYDDLSQQIAQDTFTGFIIFVCDFPNAEGVAYLSDWVATAQGYPMINLIRRDSEDLANWQINELYDFAGSIPLP